MKKFLQPDRQSASKSQGRPAPAPAQVDVQAAITNPAAATPAALQAMQQSAGNLAVLDWLKASPVAGGDLSDDFQRAVQLAHGSGQALPPRLRAQMEGGLHANFGQVRLHVDEQADALSRQIGARAFTVGSDVFFQRGAYAPHSPEGKRTLRHELAHVVQQGGRIAPRLRLGPENDAHEQAAEHASQERGAAPRAGTAPAGGVQRVRSHEEREKLKNGAASLKQEMIAEGVPESVAEYASNLVLSGKEPKEAKDAAIKASNYKPTPTPAPKKNTGIMGLIDKITGRGKKREAAAARRDARIKMVQDMLKARDPEQVIQEAITYTGDGMNIEFAMQTARENHKARIARRPAPRKGHEKLS